jgi:hypothetical protein
LVAHSTGAAARRRLRAGHPGVRSRIGLSARQRALFTRAE